MVAERLGRPLAALLALVVTFSLLMVPGVAYAASSVTTSADAVRVELNVLGLAPKITIPETSDWHDDAAEAHNVALANVPLVLNAGAVSTVAEPATKGARAQSRVAGLNLLTNTITADAVDSACKMTADEFTAGVTIADLKVLGLTASVAANVSVTIPGILTARTNYQNAVWNTSTGKFDVTVRAVSVDAIKVLGTLLSGSVVVAEAYCTGTVKLGAIATGPTSLVPGESGTPWITVANTGEVAAPHTTIRIPKPDPAYYTLKPASVGDLACDMTSNANFIICDDVTVPGKSTARVNLPVELKPSATGSAPPWSPGADTITATSVPVPGAPTATMTVKGQGPLVTALARSTTSGAFTVDATQLAAGKSTQATVRLTNNGPSDADGAVVTVPLTGLPSGVTVGSATIPGGQCSVANGNVRCTGVSVTRNGTATLTLNVSATGTTTPGSTWDLTNVTTSLNGTAVTGHGRLLTITDPDVNLTGGVSITPAAVTPGGPEATATIRIANSGALAAAGTTVTITGLPAGYTIGPMNSPGGGNCLTVGTEIRCSNITVPAAANGTAGSVALSLPVSISSGTTASWTGTVTAKSGDSTGTASGAVVITAVPRFTLGVDARGPADRTVSPGQPATMTIDVQNQGPSDARNAPFVVVAPRNTTFTALSLPAACTLLTPTTIRCTLDRTPADPPTTFALPLLVLPTADPATPLTGGCVSVDNDSVCGASDPALPAIALRAALSARLAALVSPAVVTPGQTGTGRITLTSAQAETGVTVTVPKGQLPAGWTVTGATVSGGVCDPAGTSIVCTGVALTAGAPKDVQIAVRVPSNATVGTTWTATGVTVDTGGERVTTLGALATTSLPEYALTASVTPPAPGTVAPGETAELKLTVTNQGPSAVTGGTFTVPAPAGTTFGQLTDPATAQLCTVDNGRTLLTCAVTLTVNQPTPELTIPLVTAPNAEPGSTIGGGCVDLDGFSGCGTGDVQLPSITLKVPATAQVAISSTAATVTPGGTATGTVRVTATRSTLTGVTVNIPLTGLPGGLQAPAVTVGNGTPCPVTNGVATCTVGTVDPLAPKDIEVTVSAPAGAATGTAWTAAGITTEIAAGTVPAPDQVLARVGAARYTLAATADAGNTPILPGGAGTLTVQVDNTGPSDARAATVTVLPPSGATFTGAGDPACRLLLGGAQATCTFDLTVAAAPLSWAFPLAVNANVRAGVPLSGGCVDLDGNGVCTGSDGAITPIAIATPLQNRLTITTTGAAMAPGAGDTGRIRIAAAADISGLTVTVPTVAPAGLTVSGVAGPLGSVCTRNPNGSFTCTGVDLSGAGHDAEITVQVAAGPTAAAATWTAAIAVTDGTETAAGTGDLAVIGAPRTAVTVTTAAGPAGGTVDPGQTANLTVTLSNAGPSFASGQIALITAPTGTVFGTPPAGCLKTLPDQLFCRVDVAANGSATLTPPISVPLNADIFTPIGGGCVDLTGVPGCGNGSDAIAAFSLRTPIERRATVAVTPATITPGDSGAATVSVTAEHGTLTNFTVSFPLALPPGITLDTLTPNPGCAQNPTNLVTCTWASIPDGQSRTVTLTASAGADLAAGVKWETTSITLADGTGTATLNGTRPLAVTGAPRHPLVTTFDPVAGVEPGAAGTIGVHVANSGPSDAPGVTVGFVAPPGTTIGSAPSGCTIVTPARITCTAGIDAGDTLTIALPVTVDRNADPTGTITGGCVDLDNDGACTSADRALPPIPLTTRFDQEITVRAERADLPIGGGTVAARLVVTSAETQNVDVLIPLSGLPAGHSVTPPVAPCALDIGGDLLCPLSLTANVPATLTVNVTNTGGLAESTTWTAQRIELRGPGGETVRTDELLSRVGTAAYSLSAALSGVPANDVVLPGQTVTITADVTNTGIVPNFRAPVRITAPTGTTFGTLVGAAQTDCAVTTPSTLTCRTDVSRNGVVASYELPLVVPANATGGTVLTGGCLDLAGDNSCGRAIPGFSVRAPLGAVLTVDNTTTPATPAPGDDGTATIVLSSSLARAGLAVEVSLTGLPSGVTVAAARLGVAPCTVGATITCPATTITAGGTATLAIDLETASSTAAGATWTPVITVTDPAGAGSRATLGPLALTVGPPDRQLTIGLDLPAPGSVLPGGTAEVTVRMANDGLSDHPGARAVFTAPSGTTFADLAGTPAAAHCTADSATQVTCVSDLAAGQSRSFKLALRVATSATAGGSLGGGCADVPGDSVCDTAIAFTLGTPFADRARMTVDQATIVPGDTGTGHVRVNTDGALTGLTLTVPLTGKDPGIAVVGAGGPAGSQCTVNSSMITCTGVALADGDHEALLDLVMRPSPALPAGVVWAPVVTLTNSSGATSQASGVLLRTGPPQPRIEYTLTAPTGTIATGTTATLTATVDNTGASDATGVAIRIKAPTGTTWGQLAGRAATDCAPVGTTQLDCRFDLAAGAPAPITWSLPVRIPANADPSQPVDGGCLDTDRDDNCDQNLPAITLTPTLAQSVTVDGNNPTLVPGATGTVLINVHTAQARAGLVVTIPAATLPTGMRVLQARVDGGACTITSGVDVTCRNITLAANGTAPITLTAQVADDAPANDTWQTDVQIAQGAQSTHVPLTAATVGAADVRVTVDVTEPSADSLLPGATGALTLNFTNEGLSQGTRLGYTVLAPAGATFPALIGAPAGLCTRTSDTRLDCRVTVAGNGRLSLAVPITIDPGADPDTPLTGGCVESAGNGSCAVPPDVAIPAIVLATPLAGRLQMAQADTTVVPGRTASGTIRVTAEGVVDNAVFTIPLTGKPSSLTITGVSGPAGSTCGFTNIEIRCTGVDLRSGLNTAVTVVVNSDPGGTPGDRWRATGMTVTANGETSTGINADLFTVGDPESAVTFTAVNTSRTVKPGETTTLTVTAANAGPSHATNRTATVIAANNTEFGALSGRAQQDCRLASATVLTCTYSVEADDSLTWALPLIVSSGVEDGDSLTGGCVSDDGNSACGDDLDVDIDATPVEQPLSTTGTLSVDGTVTAAGGSGTALVRLSATVAHTGLTLTVPLTGLPSGFRVTGAALGDDSCTITGNAVTCTGVDLAAGTPRVLRLSVTVSSAAADGAAWRATGITLVDPGDTADRLTAAGVLVSTVNTSYSIGVTVGSPSVARPAPGQTTILPITLVNSGPGNATDYTATIRIPDGTTRGTLPTGCSAGDSDRIVVCRISLNAGARKLISLPLIVDSGADDDQVLSGGCVDEALSADPVFDQTCGGRDDVAIPGITVGRHKVNLAIRYGKPAHPMRPGSPLLVKIPYTNDGSETADEVRFTVAPPAGVTVLDAAILIDGTLDTDTDTDTDADTGDGVAEVSALAATTEENTVEAPCAAVDDTSASNDVICEAPDTASLAGSELWLTLDAHESAKSGTYPMRVTVSTTSADGDSADNTVQVWLKLSAAATDDDDSDDGDGGDGDDGGDSGDGGEDEDLPTTGAQVAGLGLMSFLLIAVGAALVLLVRERRPATPETVRTGTATRGPGGSRASAEGIAAAFRAARPGGRYRRPPRHARSAPARRRHSGE
ncbi:hypothetical protein ACFY36_42750 [Actinoplanes sp. NPDC000266]